MKLENALIARLCHDLITPFNAISLGLEAFEYTNDSSLLANIKESSTRANNVLKLVRDLCASDGREFSVSQLKEQISMLLAASKIQFDLISASANVTSDIGKIIICNAWIIKDTLPRGGRATQQFSGNDILVVCYGDNITPQQFDLQQSPTSKNAIMLFMLKLLQDIHSSVSINQTGNYSWKITLNP